MKMRAAITASKIINVCAHFNVFINIWISEREKIFYSKKEKNK